MIASLALHALLLLLLGLVVAGRDRFGGDSALEFGWITPEEMRAANTPQGPIQLPGLPDRQTVAAEARKDAEAKPEEPSGGPPQVPVKPVRVTAMLDGRSESSRTRLLEQAGGNKKTEQSISQALGWLARRQLGGGNWQLDKGYPDPSEPSIRTDTGATGLALLAFLGTGQTHRSGEHRDVVAKGLKWLVDRQNRRGPDDEFDGNLYDIDEYGRQSAYYAHSQATMAICEAYALTGDESLREPAEKAVEFLLRSQHPEFGGWKYTPLIKKEHAGDLSVTGWALMALHTARASGIDVSNDDFYRASLFLDSVQEQGGARYKNMHRDPTHSVTLALTAQGLLARQYLGWPREHPPLQHGVHWLLSEENRPQWQGGNCNADAWYFQAQVLHHMGGDEWRDWYAALQALLVDKQSRAGGSELRGSWNPDSQTGSALQYASARGRLHFTALCALVLETPFRHAAILAE